MPFMSRDSDITPTLLCYSIEGALPSIPSSISVKHCDNREDLVVHWVDSTSVLLLHAVSIDRALMAVQSYLTLSLPDAAVIVLLDSAEKQNHQIGQLIRQGAQEVITSVEQLEIAIVTARLRKDRECGLQSFVHLDVLTQLANRQLFQDRLEHSLEQHKRLSQELVLLILDVDRFHKVNDQYGHLAGDQLLIGVSERLSQCTRSSDTLARIGGNTFAIIAEHINDTGNAAQIAQKLCDQFKDPFMVNNNEIYLSASIGVELARVVNFDPSQMIRRAELAMLDAKHLGRNTFSISNTPRPADRVRAGLETALHHALENDEIHMVYQPQVTMDGMNFKGVEALMRWTHPIYGDVTPINFIPILEETGLIEAYGIWGLKQSCAQFKEWLNMGVVPENSRVSVNLSPRQFRQKNLAESILDALSETGLPPCNLTLEITETMIMQRRGEAAEILETLRIEGISVAVDDFGTGYSSLAYLKMLPVDYLKIDREFIKDIVLNTDDQAIAASIIQLAHSLRLNVVAEGVETEDVQNTLLGMGCDQYQGYYFAKPMMPEEIPAVAERCR